MKFNLCRPKLTKINLTISQSKVLKTHVIGALLRHKPELATEVDNFHRTPLHMAALFQFPVGIIPSFSRDREKLPLIGEMLIRENNFSCYKVDLKKQSALHVAVKEGNAALVKVILKYSSDCLEMVDEDGRTALHLAVNYAPQIFERVGGDRLKAIISSVMSKRLINCIDNKGQTAFDIALQKGNEDRRLYRSIIGYLHNHGAFKKIIDEDSSTILSIKAETWKSDIISVSAVLIATVAFAAAFTLPGGIETKGQGPPAPILINSILFKVFVIFDALAFCYSIGSAILLNFACFASQVEDPVISEISSNALWVALVSLSITFGAAIHLVVASKCLWLAVLVWVMVCLLPVWIRAMSIAGKAHLFPRDRYILAEGIGLVYSVFISIAWVAWVVFFFGLIHPSWCWLRKKIYGINLWKKLKMKSNPGFNQICS
ncbi:hypothetical protein SUGI_0425400 [Cryptomeria japonica]|nr:hypothetical protein SUGI_0425400 [Cryptomeria japonica]